MEEKKPNADFEKAKSMAKEVMTMYQNDDRQESFNLLNLGEMGTGKTYSCGSTCRKPVHIDSFDPGGTKGLRILAKEQPGNYILDTRYEAEDPMKPQYFDLWKGEMDKRINSGYFENLGTYILDSSTMWAEAIMNSILKKAGIAGQAPRFTHDYTPQKTLIRNFIRKMLDLPCDFILTGHLEANKDEVSGQLTWRYATTGKGTVIIPALFDEVWVMEPKESSKGTKYKILTESNGKYSCRSRLSAGGLLDKYEPADIKGILKKVKLLRPDLPALS